MKSSLLIATLIVAGAGAMGAAVGALQSLQGSDTLFNVTNDVIQFAGLTNTLGYVGGGSGNGENAMIGKGQDGGLPSQTVAPMSKMMDNGICAKSDGGALVPPPMTGAGCVIGLDGVALFVSTDNGGSVLGNGQPDDGGACTVPGQNVDTTVGENWSRTVCGYTPLGWRDVIMQLWFGKNATTGVVDCDNSIRICLANTYGSFFENGANPVFGDATTVAGSPMIRHLWRRDDASGTTDVFGSLLGFPGPGAAKGGYLNCLGYWMGSDSFCNDSANLTGVYNTTPPGQMPGVEINSPLNYSANDMQDRDPIRRDCFNSRSNGEQVCEGTTIDPTIPSCVTNADCNSAATNGVCGLGAAPYTSTGLPYTQNNNYGNGCTCSQGVCTTNISPTLGLVLPIVTSNKLEQQPSAVQYPINACDTYCQIDAPTICGPRGTLINGLCPNGDTAPIGICYVPCDDTVTPPTPNCLSSTSTTNGPTLSNTLGQFTAAGASDSLKGTPPSGADPRVFNLYAYSHSPAGWNYALDDSGRPIAGDAFFRIHSTKTLQAAGQSAYPCRIIDATDRIGCLVQASPLSIGFAGRGGLTPPPDGGTTFEMTSLRVLGVPSTSTCIQDFEYPYTRKLYLNTIIGFQNVQTQAPNEFAFAKAECSNLFDGGAASIINSALVQEDFVTLPGFVNGGLPYCEDYNEQMLCGATSNADGCTAGQAAGIAPGLVTTCGNGTKEEYEDCDPYSIDAGTFNFTNCSNTCRFTH